MDFMFLVINAPLPIGFYEIVRVLSAAYVSVIPDWEKDISDEQRSS